MRRVAWLVLPEAGPAAAGVWWIASPGRTSGSELREVRKVHPTHAEGEPTETAVFAGGCFWPLEHAFREVEGVVATRTGLAGGAEAVEVRYDPRRVSYDTLIEVFAANHEPMETPGHAVGASVHRSAIFIVKPEQLPAAEAFLDWQRNVRGEASPATSVLPLLRFDAAGETDQQYFEKRGRPSLFTD